MYVDMPRHMRSSNIAALCVSHKMHDLRQTTPRPTPHSKFDKLPTSGQEGVWQSVQGMRMQSHSAHLLVCCVLEMQLCVCVGDFVLDAAPFRVMTATLTERQWQKKTRTQVTLQLQLPFAGTAGSLSSPFTL